MGDQLQQALNGLGPWGVPVGILLVFLVSFLKSKLGTSTPVLDASIALIRAKHTSAPTPAPVSRDISHDTAMQLIGSTVPVSDSTKK